VQPRSFWPLGFEAVVDRISSFKLFRIRVPPLLHSGFWYPGIDFFTHPSRALTIVGGYLMPGKTVIVGRRQLSRFLIECHAAGRAPRTVPAGKRQTVRRGSTRAPLSEMAMVCDLRSYSSLGLDTHGR